MSKEVVAKYARNLGLDLNETRLLKTAFNDFRMLTSEPKWVSLKLSQSCLVVLSLHVAAEKLSLNMDQADAIRSAGVTKKKYLSLLKMVRADIGAEKIVSLEEVCVSLGCPNARVDAAKLLSTYRKHLSSKLGVKRCQDLSLDGPLYTCGAVAIVCKDLKLKYDKKKLLNLSGDTKAKLKEVKTALSGICNDKNYSEKSSKDDDTIENHIKEDIADKSESKADSKKWDFRANVDENDFDPEEYEAWKEKMLKIAGLI